MEEEKGVVTKERKDVCSKEQGAKDGDYSLRPWHTHSRTWRIVENSRVSNKKLLVARSNQRSEAVCKRV